MSTSVQDWPRAHSSSSTTGTSTIPPLALSLGSNKPPSPKSKLVYGQSNSPSLEYMRRSRPGANSSQYSPHSPELSPTDKTAIPSFPKFTQTAPNSPLNMSPTASPSVKNATLAPARPALVHKKSGELVKPSLKIPMVRTKSLPNTKNVHFAAQESLVDVRRFNGRERPASVSLSESDTTDDEDDDEEEWTMQSPNFTPRKYTGSDRPNVYLESVYLAEDTVKGSILVRNIGFSKTVVIRYSANFWASAAEVQAKYTDDIRKKDRSAGFDRFLWELPLSSLPLCRNSYSGTTVLFAIQYTVNNEEFWDNNRGMNYELTFRDVAASWDPFTSPQQQQLQQQHQQQQQQQQRPQLNRIPSFLTEEPAGTPKLRTDNDNPLKSRYSFGAALSNPRFGDQKAEMFSEDYEDILQRYCFYTPRRCSE